MITTILLNLPSTSATLLNMGSDRSMLKYSTEAPDYSTPSSHH